MAERWEDAVSCSISNPTQKVGNQVDYAGALLFVRQKLGAIRVTEVRHKENGSGTVTTLRIMVQETVLLRRFRAG
jgi:hypothetical protein